MPDILSPYIPLELGERILLDSQISAVRAFIEKTSGMPYKNYIRWIKEFCKQNNLYHNYKYSTTQFHIVSDVVMYSGRRLRIALWNCVEGKLLIENMRFFVERRFALKVIHANLDTINEIISNKSNKDYKTIPKSLIDKLVEEYE